MDPLEKALAKARKQHSSEQLYESRQPATMLTPAEETPVVRKAELNGQGAEISELRFEKTRIQPVPKEILEKYRLVAGEDYNSVADRYRMLRVQVLRKLSQVGARTLGICSANTGTGKSLTAANLAISLALDPNRRVLLADFDLRRPTLHKYFGLQEGPALADYLAGEADLEECLVSPGIGSLVVLPVGRPVRNSSEVLSAKRTTDLIRELGSRYPDRVVIFDLPPLLVGDDALVVLDNIDAALLVVREGQTQGGEIQACLSILHGHQLLGTVLNCAKEENLYPYY